MEKGAKLVKDEKSWCKYAADGGLSLQIGDGPPLCMYASTSKAMFAREQITREFGRAKALQQNRRFSH